MRRLLSITTPLLLLLVPDIAQADQFDLCVPRARGVPGIAGPPDWWTPNPDEPVQWTGATAQYFDGGATFPAGFRAVWDRTSRKLSLDVQVRGDNLFDSANDHVVFALDPTSASNDEVFLVISPLQVCTSAADATCTAGKDITAANIQWATPTPTGWTPLSTTAPAGFSITHAQVTTDPSTPTTFGWQVKMELEIPVDAGTGEAGADFRLYSDILIHVNTGLPTGSVVQYPWPRQCQPPTPTCQTVMTSTGAAANLADGLPAQANWGRLTTGESCDYGVKLERNRMGSNVDEIGGLPGSTINPNSPTTFRAEIENLMSDALENQEVQATFRIADWGITPASPDLWKEIGTTTLSGTLPAGAFAVVPPATPTQGTLQINWQPTPAEVPQYQANRHQCVQVDLSVPTTKPAGASTQWGNLTFANTGVYRNMNFATLSTFERIANINVYGLHEVSGVDDAQRVLLHVHRSKMATPEECRRTKGQAEGCNNGRGKKFTFDPGLAPPPRTGKDDQTNNKPKGEGQWDPDALPRFVVHGYVELAGKKVNLLGKPQVPILHPFGGFGYHIIHAGDLAGFETFIDGAEKVADDLYALKVPKNHVAQIGTRLRAIDAETKPCSENPEGAACKPLALGQPTAFVPPVKADPDPDPKPAPDPEPKPVEPKKRCGCAATGSDPLDLGFGLIVLAALRRTGRRRQQTA